MLLLQARFFLWLKLHNITDTNALIEETAAAANVLFVPGQAFDPTFTICQSCILYC